MGRGMTERRRQGPGKERFSDLGLRKRQEQPTILFRDSSERSSRLRLGFRPGERKRGDKGEERVYIGV